MDSIDDQERLNPPGTTSLLDKQNTNTVVLSPTPSTSPNDPLNWSPRRKTLQTAMLTLYTFTNGFAASNLYSILTPLSAAKNIPLAALNAGTGYLFLLAGLSLFLWIPLAHQIGTRPVYLLSLLGLLGVNIWGVFVRSPGEWYARSVVAGFFASPVEALPEVGGARIWFVHQRGRFMGLYALALVGSNFAAPIVCGFIENGMGWRWVFWWSAIFCGIVTLVLFFALEETNWDGPPTHSPLKPEQNHHATIEHIPSYRRRLTPFDTPRPFIMHRQLLRQLTFLTWPVPLFAGFAYGSTLIWFNVLNATASSVLSAPPYSFAPDIVGLCYVAPLLGVAAASLCTGPLSDALLRPLARRNQGRFEPEARLLPFALASVTIPAGLLLWGLGAAAQLPWPALLVAMGLLAFQNACGASVAVAYLVDCYREAAGDALTAVIVVRNCMGFAIGYGITPWIEGMGLRGAFGLAAGVGFAVSLAWIPMAIWGKSIRRASAGRYWKLVDQMRREDKR